MRSRTAEHALVYIRSDFISMRIVCNEKRTHFRVSVPIEYTIQDVNKAVAGTQRQDTIGELNG